MNKKSLVIIIVALIGISLALPAVSEARRGGGRGGRGWHRGGAFMGGALLGVAIARPWYYYGPSPYYDYPSPVVYTPMPVYSPNQANAYPDPTITPLQDSMVTPGTDSKSSSGQWVEVPGQSINGKWVPSHKAWVPDNL